MKTYIILTKTNGFIATTANNKAEAHSKVVNAGYKANKGNVSISACDIAYVSCSVIK